LPPSCFVPWPHFTPPPPGYVLLDASARTTVLDGKVQVGLEVKNLLNQRYRDSMSLLRFFADQPGREIWLRLSVSLDSDDTT
jgi:outer membrane receptor protein involved in Fe transport